MIIPFLLFSLIASPPLPDESSDPRPPIIVRTLQMNPEKPREIVGWWVGRDGLIEIARDGRYRHWPTIDRFAPPEEYGRWHRENHAVFWLEAYTIPKVSRRRAALWLRNDALMTDLTRDEHPFQWRKTPPSIPAEDLIGVWEGPGGTLELTTDRRYQWTAPDTDHPAMIAGQRGLWSLGPDGRFVLSPMLASQESAITVQERDENRRIVRLRSPMGTLTRRPPPTPPESVKEDSSKKHPEGGEGPISP